MGCGGGLHDVLAERRAARALDLRADGNGRSGPLANLAQPCAQWTEGGAEDVSDRVSTADARLVILEAQYTLTVTQKGNDSVTAVVGTEYVLRFSRLQ